MTALPSKAWVKEEEYMHQILPLMEALREGVESEAVIGDARGWDVI
jgi:hypothetical protein